MKHANHLLRRAPFFCDLDDATFQFFLASAITRDYDADEIVAWENEITDGVSIIISGWLKGVKTTLTGREQILRTFGPGDTFGMITVLADTPNHLRIVTLEKCEIQKIPGDVFINRINDNPAFSYYLIRYLSQNLSTMIGLVEDLSLKSVESRLAKFILSQSENNIYLRKKWETQDLIAARIGTVPDVLSRIMRNFEDEGIIHFDRQQITVIDPQALQKKTEA
jgi:CRP/FNR family transcriptional regulator